MLPVPGGDFPLRAHYYALIGLVLSEQTGSLMPSVAVIAASSALSTNQHAFKCTRTGKRNRHQKENQFGQFKLPFPLPFFFLFLRRWCASIMWNCNGVLESDEISLARGRRRRLRRSPRWLARLVKTICAHCSACRVWRCHCACVCDASVIKGR